MSHMSDQSALWFWDDRWQLHDWAFALSLEEWECNWQDVFPARNGVPPYRLIEMSARDGHTKD
jgi:hypothetical protein